MMNRLLFGLLVITGLFYSCSKHTVKRISLSVSLINYPEQNGLILYELEDKYVPVDTAFSSQEGDYIFYTNIKRTGFFQLRFDDKQVLNLILHPNSETIIRADAEHVLTSAVINNNHDSNNILRAERLARGFNAELKAIISEYDLSAIKKSIRDSILQNVDTLKEIRKQILADIIKTDSVSLSILPVLLQKSGNISFFNPDSDRNLFIQVDTFVIRNFDYLDFVRQFHYQLDSAYATIDSTRNILIGDRLIDPEVPTFWGESLPINKFRGKPVLVIIWKSDMKNCEWFIPRVEELMRYKRENKIEIIMISLDDNKTDWENAINYNRLACWNMGDLKGMKSNVVKKWGIRSLPSNIFIDSQGFIVSKNTWGPLLESSIQNLISN